MSRSAYADRPHSVYRLYGHEGQLLYIGCARDVEGRIYMHETAWYSNEASMAIREAGGIASHTAVEYPTRDQALAVEREAIREEAPLVNRQGNPSRWRKTPAGYVPVELEDVAS